MYTVELCKGILILIILKHKKCVNILHLKTLNNIMHMEHKYLFHNSCHINLSHCPDHSPLKSSYLQEVNSFFTGIQRRSKNGCL